MGAVERLRGLLADTETTCLRVARMIECATEDFDADELDDDNNGKVALIALRHLEALLSELDEIAERAREERLEQDRQGWLAPRQEGSP